MLDGEFRPSGSGSEWCDAEVLRSLRRRSLARLRKEVEPVPRRRARPVPARLAARRAPSRGPRGVDGVLTVIDQLAGAPVPASALESLVLPARVRDYETSYLDELTAAGEVLWAGHGTLPGSDGWVSLHLADQAALTLPEHAPLRALGELHQKVLDALEPGGAWFFRQLADSVASTDDRALSAALWDLVWAGRISNDTLTPLRALTRGGRATHRTKGPPPRLRMSSTHRDDAGGMPARTGPPETAGRWALLPTLDTDPTRRAHATAERLLDRHGVVIRGAVVSERSPGGFAAAYKVLSAFEDTGRCRRGYFVDGLGAAQFGTAGAIDRLRTFSEVDPHDKPVSAVPRGHRPGQPVRRRARPGRPSDGGHRPGRKAGRSRGPGRRRAHDLRRARRQDAAHLVRGRRPARPGRRGARRRGPPRLARPDDRRDRRRHPAARRRLDPRP